MLGKLSCNVGNIYPTMNVMSTAANDSHWQQFGRWLRQKRLDASLTQAGLGQKAGITDVQIARIEKGESGTKRETVINLAEAIGLDIIETLNKAGFDAPRPEGSEKVSSYDAQVQDLAKSLEGFADGLEKIESPEDRAALLDDLKTIAGSMIDRELAAQERRKRARIN